MFLDTSRYAKTPTVQVTLPGGAQIAAVELRTIPPQQGDPTPITGNDRLDIMAQRNFGDGTRFWHIADANTEMDSALLLEPWLDGDRNAPQISISVPEN